MNSSDSRNTFLPAQLIPRPRSIQAAPGSWILPGKVTVAGDIPSPAAVGIIDDALTARGGAGSAGNRPVHFLLTTDGAGVGEIAAESYRLAISDSGVEIRSASPAGLFRSASVLAQLIRLAAASRESAIPACVIEDAPRYRWRGYMLDCSRHFQPVETIRRIIDVMALYRMSVLHLHLTEDQGWRLDIPSRPELVRVGARRADSIRGTGFTGRKWTAGEPHEGHYSADDIRDIVGYAAERFIEVVPEIDLPGHVSAMLAAYPHLGCTGGPYEVPFRPGIYPDVLCTGNSEIWPVLDDIVAETARLFPSKRIHFGGDEVPRNARWKDCPKCRALREAEGLSGRHGQQSHFSRQLVRLAAKYGKTAMFWSEACDDGFQGDVTGQFWLFGKKKAYRQLEAGRKILFSKHGGTYLDMPYGYLSLRRAYAYDPARKPGLSPDVEANILGIEGPMWTEWIPDETRLHFQSFPRTLALAERGWSDADVRHYRDFESRLRRHLPMLDSMGIGYALPENWNRGFQAFWWRLVGRNW